MRKGPALSPVLNVTGDDDLGISDEWRTVLSGGEISTYETLAKAANGEFEYTTVAYLAGKAGLSKTSFMKCCKALQIKGLLTGLEDYI